jgi:hypothetical protein
MRALFVRWVAVFGDINAALWGHECSRDTRRHVWTAGDVWTSQDEEWFSNTPAGA